MTATYSSAFVIGGYDYETEEYLSRIAEYDGEWKHIGNLMQARSRAMVVTYADETMIIGGSSYRDAE